MVEILDLGASFLAYLQELISLARKPPIRSFTFFSKQVFTSSQTRNRMEPRAGQARLSTGRGSRNEVDYHIVETG